MNDWGEPVSRRARQRNGDVAEAPLVSDGKVVNIMPSMVTTPVHKLGGVRLRRGAVSIGTSLY